MKTIPTNELCKGTVTKGIQISPNGNVISYIRKNTAGETLCFFDCVTKKRKKVEDMYFFNIISYVWTRVSQYILVINDPLGNNCWELWRYNVKANRFDKNLRYDNAQIKIMGVDKNHNIIIVGINNRRKDFFDVYRMDVERWTLDLKYINNTYFRIILDNHLNIMLGSKMKDGGNYGVDYLFGERREILEVDASDFFGTFPLCITSDKRILMRDSRNRDKSVVVKMDLTGQNIEVLAESKYVDVEETFVNPGSGDVEAVAFYYLTKEWTFLNKEVQQDFEILKKYSEGDLSIISTTSKGDKWIVEYNKSNYPTQYVLFDRQEKKILELMTAGGTKYADCYVKKEPIIISNANGEKMVCYLMRPIECKFKSMVVLLHGGPWQRDICKFVYIQQWLVNKGFSVLTINYRGSQGFGKKYLSNPSGNWIKILNEDIVTAVNWAIEKEITDQDKVAIMGNSFGGYMAQLGVTERPDIFKCGISIGGVSDLNRGLEYFPAYKSFQKDIFKIYLADNNKDDIGKFSPLYKVNNSTNALLLIHGCNDDVVDYTESLRMIENMKENNLEVVGMLFKGEGHSIKKQKNKLIMYNFLEMFLYKNLLNEWKENKVPFLSNEDIIIYGNL